MSVSWTTVSIEFAIVSVTVSNTKNTAIETKIQTAKEIVDSTIPAIANPFDSFFFYFITASTIPSTKANIEGKIKNTLKNGDNTKHIKPTTNEAIPIKFPLSKLKIWFNYII